jgi:hypothetical protein
MVRWLFVLLALISGCQDADRSKVDDLAKRYGAEVREQVNETGKRALSARLNIEGETWVYSSKPIVSVWMEWDRQATYDSLAARMAEGVRSPMKWYDVKCLSCGAEFQSTGEGDLESCINCPFDICDETSTAVMMIGTLQEIVRAQPQNAQAKENLEKFHLILSSHLEECEKCRDWLEKPKSRKPEKSDVVRSKRISE